MSYSAEPAVLLFGDGGANAALLAAAAEGAGLRLIGPVAIEQAPARLEAQAACGAIAIGLDTAAWHDAALMAIAGRSAADGPGVVAGVPFALIDAVAAALPQAQLLCEPCVTDCAAALVLATRRAPMRVSDIGVEGETVKLHRLAEEVARIARQLTALTDTTAAARPAARVSDAMTGFRAEPPQPGGAGDAARIRRIIRNRRARAQFFAEALFADPAWDMLLDLMAARIEGVRVAVSSLCIAAAVPPTTALRWITTMCEHGLFERIADPNDGRRVFVGLSDHAAGAMAAYLAATAGDEI